MDHSVYNFYRTTSSLLDNMLVAQRADAPFVTPWGNKRTKVTMVFTSWEISPRNCIVTTSLNQLPV